MIKRYVVLVLILSLLMPSKVADSAVVKSPTAKVDLSTKKVAYVVGDVGPTLAHSFEKQMLETVGMPGDRLILINSPGGLVSSGDKMIKLIEAEQSNGTRVVCVVLRAAHSMAFNILTRCNVRLAVPRSILLAHKIRKLGPCDPCTAKILRQWADELDKEDEQYRQANAKAMGISPEEYDIYADNETIWRAETLLTRKYLHGLTTHVEK